MPRIGNQSFSLSQVLCMCCCAPVCPRRLTDTVAFAPPEPTYEIRANVELRKYILRLTGRINITGIADVEKQDVIYAKTHRENKIVLLFLKSKLRSKYYIFYSHGNAQDLGIVHKTLAEFTVRFECDVLSYEFSGYGRSSGKPSEQNMYADVIAAWETFLAKYGVNPHYVILYGYSLGTVPTTFLATKVTCAGVILHSPLASGMRMLCKNRSSRCDTLNNLSRIGDISSPVLIIHGTDDDVIDISHGQALHKNCPTAVEPFWAQGCGHSDVENHPEYFNRIQRFINEELLTH